MAVKFATEAKPIKNNISARKSKARQAAAKSEEKAAGLEEKLALLDKECEADLSDLRALVVKLNGLPAALTVIIASNALSAKVSAPLKALARSAAANESAAIGTYS